MNRNGRFRKFMAMLLVLVLSVSLLQGLAPAMAETNESCNHTHDALCGYEETGVCSHVHDESCGGMTPVKPPSDPSAAAPSSDPAAVSGTSPSDVIAPLSNTAPVGETPPMDDGGGEAGTLGLTYTVRFFLPGDVPYLTPVEKVAEGTPVKGLLPAEAPAAEEGSVFIGWRDRDEVGSVAMTAETLAALTVTEDLNLEAVFEGAPPVNAPAAEGEPEAVEYTVTFWSEGAEYRSQQVEEGQKAALPDTPPLPGGAVSFTGWFIDEECTLKYNFETAIDANLALYAGFSDAYLVMFKDASGAVYETQQVAGGEYAAWPGSDPEALNENERFIYWYVEGDESKAQYGFLNTPVTGTITLVPMFGSEYYVFFHSRGSYVASPAAVDDGTAVARPEDPVRAGYDFAFWSTDPDAVYTERDEKEYDFALPVTGDLTLTGIWTPKSDVPYTIVFWLEKTDFSGTPNPENPSDYRYEHSITRTGTAGEMTDVGGGDSDIAGLFAGGHGTLKYAYFQSADNRTIDGGGRTVVNVYAARKVYTYTYDLGDDEDCLMTVGGVTYRGDSGNQFSIPVKYGEDVTDKLPWIGNVNATFHDDSTFSYAFMGWSTYDTEYFLGLPVGEFDYNGMACGYTTLVSRRNTIDADLLSEDGQKLTYTLFAEWELWGGSDRNYRYLVEPLGGETTTPDPTEEHLPLGYDGYVELVEYRQKLESDSTLTAKEIYGYRALHDGHVTVKWYDDKNDTWHDSDSFWFWEDPRAPYYMFFYDRNDGELTFDLRTPAGADVTNPPPHLSQTVDFGESFAGYEPSNPACEGYAFGGWYADANFREKFDFGETMPDVEEVKVYALWIQSDVTATYHSKAGGTVVDKQEYARGAALDPSEIYTAGENYAGLGEFLGWGWFLPDTDVLRPVGGDFTVERSVHLFGRWRTGGFKITYAAGGGEGELPLDEASYKLGMLAPVAGAELTRSPGERFIGWRAADGGAVYYPGSNIRIDGDVTLTAVFVNQDDQLATLTYHANYGEDPETVIEEVAPGEVTPRGADVFTRAGYALTGWSDVEGGTGVVYPFGEAVTVTDGGMTIYAVWQKEETFTVKFEIQEGRESWGYLNSEDTLAVTFEDIKKGTAFRAAVQWPEAVANEGYRFGGWTPDNASNIYVIADETFTANFVKLATVTFVAGDGVTALSGKTSFTVDAGSEWGDVITVPDATPAPYHTLGDWVSPIPDDDYVITGNMNFTVSATRDQATVTFVAGEGVTFSEDSQTTWEGYAGTPWEDITLPVAEAMESYRLTAWSPDFPTVVTGHTTYTMGAEFDPEWGFVITTGDRTKVYDGTPLTSDDYSVSVPELPSFPWGSFEIRVTPTGSQTGAGSSENTADYRIIFHYDIPFMGDEMDLTGHFTNVRVEPGTLTVTPRPVTLTADSFTKTEGTEDPVFTAQVTEGSLVDGDSIGYTLGREPGEAVGDYTIYPILLGVQNYRVAGVNGTLTITPAPVVPVDDPIVPAGPGPVVPVDDPVVPDPVDPVIPEEPVDVADPDVPLDDGTDDPAAVVEEPETPLAGGKDHWALVNLILGVLTCVMMLAVLFGYFMGKKKEDGEEVKRRGGARLLTVIPTLLAVVVFILTEDMSQPMQVTDQWTVLMVAIVIMQAAIALFTKKNRSRPEDGGARRIAAER